MGWPSGCTPGCRARRCSVPGASPTTARRSCCTWHRARKRTRRAARPSSRISSAAGWPIRCSSVTDGAPGLIRAVETCFPRALRQRCLVHRLRNLRSKAPESRWPEIALRARGCYEAASAALATVLRDDFVQTYERELPAVVQGFRDDFDACIAHLRFPLRHRRVVRTTNLLERLFLEARRRTKIIPHAFGERPVLKLMYAAVIRAAERWRGIAVGEFEQRQLRAFRAKLPGQHFHDPRPPDSPREGSRRWPPPWTRSNP